ncbi:MAG: hypothetical protein ACRCT8_00640 [Lacipirellulaceae bacterium]
MSPRRDTAGRGRKLPAGKPAAADAIDRVLCAVTTGGLQDHAEGTIGRRLTAAETESVAERLTLALGESLDKAVASLPDVAADDEGVRPTRGRLVTRDGNRCGPLDREAELRLVRMVAKSYVDLPGSHFCDELQEWFDAVDTADSLLWLYRRPWFYRFHDVVDEWIEETFNSLLPREQDEFDDDNGPVCPGEGGDA